MVGQGVEKQREPFHVMCRPFLHVAASWESLFQKAIGRGLVPRTFFGERSLQLLMILIVLAAGEASASPGKPSPAFNYTVNDAFPLPRSDGKPPQNQSLNALFIKTSGNVIFPQSKFESTSAFNSASLHPSSLFNTSSQRTLFTELLKATIFNESICHSKVGIANGAYRNDGRIISDYRQWKIRRPVLKDADFHVFSSNTATTKIKTFPPHFAGDDGDTVKRNKRPLEMFIVRSDKSNNVTFNIVHDIVPRKHIIHGVDIDSELKRVKDQRQTRTTRRNEAAEHNLDGDVTRKSFGSFLKYSNHLRVSEKLPKLNMNTRSPNDKEERIRMEGENFLISSAGINLGRNAAIEYVPQVCEECF